MAHEKNHDYHILAPSAWPLLGALAGFILLFGSVLYFHEVTSIVMIVGFLFVFELFDECVCFVTFKEPLFGVTPENSKTRQTCGLSAAFDLQVFDIDATTFKQFEGLFHFPQNIDDSAKVVCFKYRIVRFCYQ